MKVYKVLNSDLTSPFKDMQYVLGKEYVCTDFDDDNSKSCSRGLYATPSIEGCLYTNLSGDKIIVECEAEGKYIEFDTFKIRWEKLTPIRVLSEKEIRQLAVTESAVRGYNIEEALFPINPFKIKPPEITDEHISLLKNWASVRNSVRNSVWASIRPSVRHSVRNSVRYSVGDSVRHSVRNSVRPLVRPSVWDSVRHSVWAYISSLFPSQEGVNPFQSVIDLWKQGLVPSFDGKMWRLHGGGKVLYEMEIDYESL
jgi:hypothetical protein